MQTPTPRMALRKMNSDGSDVVDLDNQYNVSFDILDESFIPRDTGSVSRPNSSVGIFLREGNTDSELYSVGSNEWNCFGSYGPLYEKTLLPGSISAGVDNFLEINNSADDNKMVTTINSTTVRLLLPGLYILSASLRYAKEVNAGGMYVLALHYFNAANNALIKTTYESNEKGAEDAPMSLTLTTMHRVLNTFPQDVKLLTYQNSGATRLVQNTEVDGSSYSRFQVMYLRPCLQGV